MRDREGGKGKGKRGRAAGQCGGIVWERDSAMLGVRGAGWFTGNPCIIQPVHSPSLILSAGSLLQAAQGLLRDGAHPPAWQEGQGGSQGHAGGQPLTPGEDAALRSCVPRRCGAELMQC